MGLSVGRSGVVERGSGVVEEEGTDSTDNICCIKPDSKFLKLEVSKDDMEGNGENVFRHVELLHHIHQQCVHVWVCEQVITCRMLSNHVVCFFDSKVTFVEICDND